MKAPDEHATRTHQYGSRVQLREVWGMWGLTGSSCESVYEELLEIPWPFPGLALASPCGLLDMSELELAEALEGQRLAEGVVAFVECGSGRWGRSFGAAGIVVVVVFRPGSA